MEESKNTVWNLVSELSNKKGITEIVINDPKRVFVEREGQFIQLNVSLTKNDLYEFSQDLAKFNKKVFDEGHPILDGSLPDGSRVNIIGEPFAYGSPAITIRKYLKNIKSFDDNKNIFGLSDDWVEFFKSLVSARLNVIVSGGTGVGKTTFLNLLLQELSLQERVVTIEDTLELSIDMPNVVRLEAGQKSLHSELNVSTRDLVKNTLRMRPDRIIIGETRGGELFDLLQAMNTGHDGSMSSVHSNSPGECLSRLETLYLLAGFDVPFHAVRRQISSAVDIIVQIGRDKEGKRKVTTITELTGMEGANILSQQLAVMEDDVLKKTGIASKNLQRLQEYGGLPVDFFN